MIYNQLIIQPKIWGNLTDYFNKNKLPHALLLYGNEGVGKEAHAIEFASFINCTAKHELESCGMCNSCRKMKILQHGNLKLIHPMPRKKTMKNFDSPLKSFSKSELEDYNNQLISKGKNPYYKINLLKSNSILINSIRSLKKDLTLSSIEKGWNIILIMEAEKLCYPNNISANSLLKILEEPPKKTLFILTTSNYSKIIDTVKSRCQTIFFPPIPIDKIYDTIDDSISDIDKLVIATISDGSIDVAKKIEIDIKGLYDNLKLFITSCYDTNCNYNSKVIEKINLIRRSSNNKNELSIFFKSIMIYFKDLFIYSNSKNIHDIVYKNLEEHYDKITKYNTDTDWDSCITVIENTCDYIERNAYTPLAINGMLIELKNIIDNKYYTAFDMRKWLGIE